MGQATEYCKVVSYRGTFTPLASNKIQFVCNTLVEDSAKVNLIFLMLSLLYPFRAPERSVRPLKDTSRFDG